MLKVQSGGTFVDLQTLDNTRNHEDSNRKLRSKSTEARSNRSLEKQSKVNCFFLFERFVSPDDRHRRDSEHFY